MQKVKLKSVVTDQCFFSNNETVVTDIDQHKSVLGLRMSSPASNYETSFVDILFFFVDAFLF